MDSVEDYARQCAKRDKEQLDTLFWMGDDWWGHWCKLELNKKLNSSLSTRATSIFKDTNVARHLSHTHEQYVLVPADKAPSNIVFCV